MKGETIKNSHAREAAFRDRYAGGPETLPEPEPFKPYHAPKPWGSEFVWALTDDYCAKTLFIQPNSRLSLQYHEKKDETIFVEYGPVWVHHAARDGSGGGIIELETGGVIHIWPGQVHRFEAKDERVILFEVSTPHLHDVVRIEDDYDRNAWDAPDGGNSGELIE